MRRIRYLALFAFLLFCLSGCANKGTVRAWRVEGEGCNVITVVYETDRSTKEILPPPIAPQ